MGMKQTLDVINRMEADGVIGRYAIAGAVAAYQYVEPTLTDDLDILVAFEMGQMRPQSGLITLGPIFSYLRNKGYSEFEREAVLIEGWAVQFIPVASELDAEALAKAESVDIEINPAEGAVQSRVLRPEHLVAAALRVSRPKDLIRITQFLDEGAVDINALCGVLRRHALTEAWRAFCRRTGLADPCGIDSKP
jgi:hypothetical protein